MKRLLLSSLLAVAALFRVEGALASRVKELPYRYGQIWSSAVRFVRVDSGFPIAEKDKKAGYILFQYKDGNRSEQASFELIPIKRGAIKTVRVEIKIPSMPSYVESVLFDKLVKKLQSEHGEMSEPVIASAAGPAATASKKPNKGKPKPKGPPPDSVETGGEDPADEDGDGDEEDEEPPAVELEDDGGDE